MKANFDTLRWVNLDSHILLGFEKDGVEVGSLKLVPDELGYDNKVGIIKTLHRIFDFPPIRILSFEEHRAELLAAQLAPNKRLHADLGITVEDAETDEPVGTSRLDRLGDIEDAQEVYDIERGREAAAINREYR